MQACAGVCVVIAVNTGPRLLESHEHKTKRGQESDGVTSCCCLFSLVDCSVSHEPCRADV